MPDMLLFLGHRPESVMISLYHHTPGDLFGSEVFKVHAVHPARL